MFVQIPNFNEQKTTVTFHLILVVKYIWVNNLYVRTNTELQ